MSSRTKMYLGMFVGSTIGGYLPLLWGGGVFSMSGVILSGLGGIVGLVIAYKYSN